MRRTVLTVLLLTTILLRPAPAVAGGPTSVLVTSPEAGRATAFYWSDAEYVALDEALHGSGATEGEPNGGSTFYNLTWLIHDVSIWRTDRVAVSRDGVWVSSADPMTGSSAEGPWREVADGASVRAVLDGIGTGGPDLTTADQDESGALAAALEEPQPQASAPPAVPTETRWFSLTGWRWTLPGALVGALLVGMALSRRRGPAEPRQQLVDEEPERVRVPG